MAEKPKKTSTKKSDKPSSGTKKSGGGDKKASTDKPRSKTTKDKEPKSVLEVIEAKVENGAHHHHEAHEAEIKKLIEAHESELKKSKEIHEELEAERAALSAAHEAEKQALAARLREAESRTNELEEQVQQLGTDLEAAKNAKKEESENDNEELDQLKGQVESLRRRESEQNEIIEDLTSQVADLSRAKETVGAEAQQAKSDFAAAGSQISSLKGRVEQLQEEKLRETDELKQQIEELAKRVREFEAEKGIKPKTDSSVPSWKQRQMEKEKEEEGRKAAEKERKLTKVTSIKIRTNEIGADRVDVEEGEKNVDKARPVFRDPLEIKQQQASAVSDDTQVGSGAVISEMTQAEKEAAEEARLMKFLKR